MQAYNGDCIHLSYLDDNKPAINILVDGGTGDTYEVSKNKKGKKDDGPFKHLVEEIKASGQSIDLLILTHIDDDHIGGILRWFNQDSGAAEIVRQVWFNGGREIASYLEESPNDDLDITLDGGDQTFTSHQQGINFAHHLYEGKAWKGDVLVQGQELSQFGFLFKILSPDKTKLTKLIKDWKKKSQIFLPPPGKMIMRCPSRNISHPINSKKTPHRQMEVPLLFYWRLVKIGLYSWVMHTHLLW